MLFGLIKIHAIYIQCIFILTNLAYIRRVKLNKIYQVTMLTANKMQFNRKKGRVQFCSNNKDTKLTCNCVSAMLKYTL